MKASRSEFRQQLASQWQFCRQALTIRHKLADLIDLDICLVMMKVYLKEFGSSKYRLSRLLKEMVVSGRLGHKTGQDAYKY